jgi:hypothetical protein
MIITSKQYNKIFLIFISFILIVSIFKWIDYFTEHINININENFTNHSYSHTVDLPLTNTSSCSNFCGPAARCAITGHQCLSDIDCPGCKINMPKKSDKLNENIPGANDAGKLTLGVTPQYSSLTNGYGTHEKIITKNMFSKPSVADFGMNIWKPDFLEEQKMFDERYKPTNVHTFPQRFSLTGEFIEDGPFASNAEI